MKDKIYRVTIILDFTVILYMIFEEHDFKGNNTERERYRTHLYILGTDICHIAD
ncbi:MAG: hypothetical protein NC307_00525 [Roseburia sp.]|nr:hypothetical protein [Roseburia sp.]